LTRVARTRSGCLEPTSSATSASGAPSCLAKFSFVSSDARAGSILRMVLWQGTLPAAAGVLPGTCLAYAAGKAMRALLAGVSPADVPTLAAAIVLSLAMTLPGSLLPALRAARPDPATVMRAE
jgi:ABC-type antimicrobial peptide transport system permease subunit